jgi:hypothetical protein
MGRYLSGLAVTAAVLALIGCQKAPPSTSNAAPATPAPVATNAAPASASAATSDAADVKAFLDGVYAHYKTGANNTFQALDANAPEVFDADTIALMKADTAALHGEVGDLDGDPICQCQDFGSIQAAITVQSATPTTATATANFKDVSFADAKPQRDTFDLTKTSAGWRIHDIHTADSPSLRKMLQAEVAKLKNTPPSKAPAGADDDD